MTRSVDTFVVGHYCHDTLILREGRHQALGGSSSYISSVLQAEGASFAVLAKVGEDFRYFDKVIHAPLVVPEARTTTFVNDYSIGNERAARLESVCPPIRAHDVEKKLEKCRIAMACGVAGEILPETLLALRARAELLLCDAQALIRFVDGQQRVCHVPLVETAHQAVVDRIDFLKASAEEASYLELEPLRKKTKIIITEGKRGCRLLTASSELRVPAYPASEVDGTGAGDCFFAGFALGLSRGLELERALELANFYGAQAVSQVGVPELKGVGVAR
jgi:1D-myo-inositol 3-kinase